jgi:hypothetical protein
MDKLKLTGQTWVNFSSLNEGVLVYAMQLHQLYKQPNLKLTQQSLSFSPVSFNVQCLQLGRILIKTSNIRLTGRLFTSVNIE